MSRPAPLRTKAPGPPGLPGTPGAAAVAAAFIGTVVGAGFASGQEVWRFFTTFGKFGTLGILLSTALFVFFGLMALRLGERTQARSHAAIVEAVGGGWPGRVLDGLITFFLFGALATMVAGAGAIFEEELGAPALAGNLLLLAATLATVWSGLQGVIGAMRAVTPLLLATAVGLSLATLSGEGGTPPNFPTDPSAAPLPWWPAAAVLYVSYNMVGAVSVLTPLGGAGTGRAAQLLGATLGGSGLGLALAAIHLALAASEPAATAYKVPMLHVAKHLGPVMGLVYSGVLLAEVYTTAVACLYGLASRIAESGRSVSGKAAFRRVALVTGTASLAAGHLGFAQLVGTFYPLAGLAGLVLLILLAGQVRPLPR